MTLKAVLFDVDFTLIYPGPTFRGEGYRAFCERYGMNVDASMFSAAVASAARDAEASGLADPVVLLSPACASFDQYRNFEIRGTKFRDLVTAMPGVKPVV